MGGWTVAGSEGEADENKAGATAPSHGAAGQGGGSLSRRRLLGGGAALAGLALGIGTK